MSNNYSPADLRSVRKWVADEGGDLFKSFDSFEWFMRMHRRELIESGELFTKRGAGGNLVGPRIGEVCVRILQREMRAVVAEMDSDG